MVDNLLDSTSNSLNNQNGINDYLQRMFGIDNQDLRINVILDMDSTAYDDKISELERAYMTAQGIGQTAISMGSTSVIAREDHYISTSLQQLANSEAYRSSQLQRMYDLIDSYVTESKLASNLTVSGGGEAGQTINNFTQNNYSPKAISRLDTYRQTERQFNTFMDRMSKTKR